MRQTQILSGSSHPELVESICGRLGSSPAQAELGKFANGETKVQLNTSIRDQDVFVVQSGSNNINDDLMELLIMISACKSGSAKKITAVMPYFPYSRQSKKKSHRGSITARMVANLLHEAGVNHVITLDLHASQMQGFFHCPVDNLVAEPLLARWIMLNIRDWKKAVVVSKNPGGTKRVTSLADALKLNFGIIMTDRTRPGSGHASMVTSTILDGSGGHPPGGGDYEEQTETFSNRVNGVHPSDDEPEDPRSRGPNYRPTTPRRRAGTGPFAESSIPQSPLRYSHTASSSHASLPRAQTAPSTLRDDLDASTDEEDDDDPVWHLHKLRSNLADNSSQRTRDVVTGRLVHGHIVEDDALTHSPSSSTLNGFHHSSADDDESVPDHMLSSTITTTSSLRAPTTTAGLGGSGDAHASSDDEEEILRNPEMESTVTLVGNVRDRPVFILDDMIDKSASWIAAAETVVKRGGATAVYCLATHGLFGDDALKEMEDCDCIDGIIVTNAFPIPDEKTRAGSTKLRVLDVSQILAEAIRRNHNGETIEQLFVHSIYD